MTPILIYNSNSLAATKTEMEKLDTCERRHLRNILGIVWPRKITNEELYHKCEIEPISKIINHSRWKNIGKIMRMPLDSPPQQALDFVTNGSKKLKARK